MVRSDSADEEQIINDDGFDLIEEDEEMSPDVDGSLPVIIPEWSRIKNGQLISINDCPESMMVSQNSSFDLTNSTHNTLRSVLPTSTIGHAPLLTNRSISQPAPLSPQSTDPDRRLRRQIANCNERRRMQSINAGFMALRSLLPRKEGEKLSKAAILQQTADLVHQLLQKNFGNVTLDGCEAKKPKLDDDNMDVDHQNSMILQLQASLDHERSARKMLEQKVVQLQETLQRRSTEVSSPISNVAPSYPLHSAYVTPTISNSITDSPERKPSFHEPTSSPLSMLNLNGSPCSSESLVAPILTPTLNMNPSFSLLETTVIRPTPLAPISVEVSSPSLSTPSPLTVPQPLAPIIFTTPRQNQSIMFPTAVHPVTSSISTGTSTPVSLPPLSVHHHSQPSAFVSTSSNFGAHHSLQTIIDAIRHLEGNSFLPPSPPATSQTSLVR